MLESGTVFCCTYILAFTRTTKINYVVDKLAGWCILSLFSCSYDPKPLWRKQVEVVALSALLGLTTGVAVAGFVSIKTDSVQQ
jgi:hypothetical protein